MVPREEEQKVPLKIYEEDYTIPKIVWDIECIIDWNERIANYTDE